MLADNFARENFTLRASLRLHKVALGWDLLRAPGNIALAPVFMVLRLTSALTRFAGFPELAHRIGSRKVFMTTAVTRELEARLWLAFGGAFGSVVPARAAELRRLIRVYCETRSAVAEAAVSLFVILAGALVFRTLTPGLMSLAPLVGDEVAYQAAVSSFPLGETLGGAWYGLFSHDAGASVLVAVGSLLVFAASLASAFIGILADPVQLRLGIHRRRLARLLAALERQAGSDGSEGFAAPEHYVPRLGDAADITAAVLRFLRG